MKADWCQGTSVVPITWGLIECAVGVVSCGLPTLRSLFVKVFGRCGTTSGSAVSHVGGSGSKHFQHTANGSAYSTDHDSTLRPPFLGTMTNSFERNMSDHGPNDEVMLTGINVRTDIEWSESSPGAALSPLSAAVARSA